MSQKDPWVEDPQYPVEDWVEEVTNNDTRLGYVDWVAHRRESDQEQEPKDGKPPWWNNPVREFKVEIIEKIYENREVKVMARSFIEARHIAYNLYVEDGYDPTYEDTTPQPEDAKHDLTPTVNVEDRSFEITDDEGYCFVLEDSADLDEDEPR